jgi:hypothetical protein
MEYPPSSPDLALNDFWLVPKIKSALKGPRFQDTETKKNVTIALENCSTTVLKKCFQQ